MRTAHLVLADPPLDADNVRSKATQMREKRFHIGHATLQVESTDCGDYGLHAQLLRGCRGR